MRLVLLTTNMAPGGAEKQVAELAIRMAKLHWDVHVISLIKPSAFASDLADAGVRLHSPGPLFTPSLIRRLQPDILHAHMFHANIMSRILRLAIAIPIVINTIHSMAESSRKSAVVWRRDLLYRITAFLPDRTVAISQAAADRHVSARCVRRAALRVIPNGVDCSLYQPARTHGEEFTWLAAGRLHWKKDYPTLLRAFAKLGRGRLLIAGAGPEETELRRLAPQGVQFLGQRSDLAELMRAADAFVLSSVVEGLPVVLLEAAASGLPAVATDAGGVRETDPAFLVPKGDADALAKAMQTLMSMGAEDRAQLASRARERALARWDWPVVLEQWLQLYRELAHGRD